MSAEFVKGRIDPKMIKLLPIEVFENLRDPKSSVFHQTITIKSDELSAVCPASENPDIYQVEIKYSPEKFICELKSLKLYFQGFRNVGIFVEDLSEKIIDDFYKIVQPFWVNVTLIQNSRGGIITRSDSYRNKSDDLKVKNEVK